MSRGPGAIERAIEGAFVAHPSMTFSVEELATLAYPGINRVEKKHRVAVIRAADKVADRLGWQSWKVYRPTHPRIYVNLYDLKSYAVGRIRAEWSDGTWSAAEIERRLYIADPNECRSFRYLIEPGGTWFEHVEIAKLFRAGNTVEAEARQKAQAESLEVLLNGLKGR